MVQRAAIVCVSDESLYADGEDDLILGKLPFVYFIQENRQLDSALKVYHLSSVLEVEAGAARHRSTRLAKKKRVCAACEFLLPSLSHNNGFPVPIHAQITTTSAAAQNTR